jgi:hypothetical protein
MALATTYPFSKFLVLIGNGATPEVFTDPCGLTSKGFTRSANMNDTNIPDCANPDAASWLARDVVSYQGTIRGAGVVAQESFSTWEGWWTSALSKNIQIMLVDANPSFQKVWLGPCKLQEIVITADRGQRVTMTVNIVSDGAITLQ